MIYSSSEPSDWEQVRSALEGSAGFTDQTADRFQPVYSPIEEEIMDRFLLACARLEYWIERAGKGLDR